MNNKVEMFKVEEHILKKVAQVFDKNKSCLEQDVIVLQEWLDTQPHLPKLLDSSSLLNFLVFNKGSIELAKEKINNYYTIRSKLPEIYDEINPKFPYCKEMENMAYGVTYPKLSEEMYRFFFLKIKNPNLVEKFEPIDLAKYLITIQEIRLREDILYGEVFVIDCEGSTLSMAFKITPSFLHKTLILIYKQVYCFRLKAIYLLNFPSYGGNVLSLLKNFMTPKLRNRIHICPDIDSLKKHISSEILPKEFGGEGLSLEVLTESLNAKRAEYQDLFDSLDEAKVDESLIPEKLKNDDFLGFHGNFKKLNID